MCFSLKKTPSYSVQEISIVVLPPLPHDTAQDGAGVDADAHVDLLPRVLVKLLDGGDHGQAHLNAVERVVWFRLWAACGKRGSVITFSFFLVAPDLVETLGDLFDRSPTLRKRSFFTKLSFLSTYR